MRDSRASWKILQGDLKINGNLLCPLSNSNHQFQLTNSVAHKEVTDAKSKIRMNFLTIVVDVGSTCQNWRYFMHHFCIYV